MLAGLLMTPAPNQCFEQANLLPSTSSREAYSTLAAYIALTLSLLGHSSLQAFSCTCKCDVVLHICDMFLTWACFCRSLMTGRRTLGSCGDPGGRSQNSALLQRRPAHKGTRLVRSAECRSAARLVLAAGCRSAVQASLPRPTHSLGSRDHIARASGQCLLCSRCWSQSTLMNGAGRRCSRGEYLGRFVRVGGLLKATYGLICCSSLCWS